MKAVMYHYVREQTEALPYFRYLHIDDFRKQLDFFERRYTVLRREQFLSVFEKGAPLPENAIVLTFDDGLSDHYHYAYPELVRRGLFGIFYVPTGPMKTGQCLDVHKIHLLTGTVDSETLLRQMNAVVTEDMISHAKMEAFREHTYVRQHNSDAIKTIKRTLNYFMDAHHRSWVIDQLLQTNGLSAASEGYYLNPAQMNAMQQQGMLIGSHSVSHPVMSCLSAGQQAEEIQKSFVTLEQWLGSMNPRSFCYPYGGFHSFNDTTEKLLAEEGCLFSFNVESRDITPADIEKRPQALPRYDCNEFEHGAAR